MRDLVSNDAEIQKHINQTMPSFSLPHLNTTSSLGKSGGFAGANMNSSIDLSGFK